MVLAKWGMGALFTVAALSQAKVQVVDRNATLQRAKESNRFTLTHEEVAKRGSILSSDGKVLAQDDDSYQLVVDFRKVPHSDAFFLDLSDATGISATEFSQLAANPDVKSRTWLEPVTQEQARKLALVRQRWRADGLSAKSARVRSYPLAEAAAGIVGMVRSGVPLSGLEVSQEKTLAGIDGQTVGQVDRTGAFLPMRLDESTKAKIDGKPIELTIDSELQQAALASVRQSVDKFKADRGVAIIISPKTGEILAMANWPTFNPREYDAAATGPTSDLNPATSAILEPGSTFKILTLAEALNTGHTTMTEIFHCGGVLAVGNKSVHCDSHHGNRAHGTEDASKAIAKSCNVVAATWALRIGRPAFLKYIESLGLLEKPELGLPLEARGQFNYKEYAQKLQLANVGFGQSINVTPVALASAFSMLGNDGIRMKPFLIHKIGNTVTQPQAMARSVSSESAAEVMQCMEAVIESDAGTGKTLRIPGYRLAGKTGTAQKINKKSGGGYVSNFVGFVPARNPKALILVMIDHPKSGVYYGASVAGPVFLDLAKSVIRRYMIPPDSTALSSVPAHEAANQKGPTVEVKVSR